MRAVIDHTEGLDGDLPCVIQLPNIPISHCKLEAVNPKIDLCRTEWSHVKPLPSAVGKNSSFVNATHFAEPCIVSIHTAAGASTLSSYRGEPTEEEFRHLAAFLGSVESC